ncbi:MAG: Hydrogenase isoenzymes formation protein HypE [Planctomycetes bacterium ADurb.Bin126]|nr:MAG: Hydrogenase isoenzymes formation protein HypE [Planctomycetes bacterium ADurb.Bin126]HOD82921.1 hydrogenase expression/formation protein HypE [Phycisphaerae bacterium]HQL74357.1 hydrogenase expression/formation protein HypE [Phycisphaerae bacterium]
MDTSRIQLAHGGGGQLTAELIRDVILPALGGGQDPHALADAAVLETGGGRLAFTTDMYVVQPLEFPGGDIGKLAVCGTINDLAVCGAKPLALSMGLVLQEGLEIDLLQRVLDSAGRQARQAGIRVVTGDTKVVERSALDGIIVNTSGVGLIGADVRLGFDRIQSGDRVVLSGPLGEHGLAVMSQRKGLSFTADLVSDCAPLHELVSDLLDELGENLRFMRDPTRSGLAAVLADIAESRGVDIEIEESAIPAHRTARSAAEMLGLDLLQVANEGKLVAVVAEGAARRAVDVMRRHAIGSRAAVIGTIGPAGESPIVELATAAGGRRIVQMPYGEELPRIC